jgi:predicted GH43/DUF377 family glycosyl hydrolase
LGWQAQNAPSERALKLISDVAGLRDDEVAVEYQRVVHDFQSRHWQIDEIFDQRCGEVLANSGRSVRTWTAQRRKLLGAYFCHEYTYAAAALMNPSIAPHPDQSGIDHGYVRFVMSLRAVGEGHISSIVFREGIAGADGAFKLWPQGAFATAAELATDASAVTDGAVRVQRNRNSNLSNTVIFPITEQQRNGLEDLRLVKVDDVDGGPEWIGTYTAYSGSAIRSELLRTRDFAHFTLEPIQGRAARNKGMALFPTRINGRYAMVGRQDGKNLYLLYSDDLSRWDDDGVLIMEPKYPWEFVQIGNCGAPILTDEGWLLLTHGVGAMRKYALGCALLDRDNPSRVIARTRTPILAAEDADRSGYVPNVVYTCGALKVGDHILIPYGISDSAVGFASTSVSALLAVME